MERRFDRSDRFQNYISIAARFDSTGTCGHPIKRGDPIGYNRVLRRTSCRDCWATWVFENQQADAMERELATGCYR